MVNPAARVADGARFVGEVWIERRRRDIDRSEVSLGAVSGEEDCLGADPAASFQNPAAGRVHRVVVQQFGKGLRLIIQAPVLAIGVTVNIFRSGVAGDG